jgi:diacylglycerol kinase family enzyme
MRFIGVFNKDGGAFRTIDVAEFAERTTRIFAAHGQMIEVRLVERGNLLAELERAAGSSVDALLAGGGDGTVSAAATCCFRTGMPLAALPAGTMNMFARSLQIPLDLEQALSSLAAGSVRSVDIATVNDRPFVHQFSVGIHPRLVRIRDGLRYRGSHGKMLATLRALGRAVRQPPVFEVEIRTTRGFELRRATGVSVSNNLLGEGHVPHADRLDGGVLGVYVAEPMPPAELARFCVSVIMGRWKSNPLVSEQQVEQVVLRFRRQQPSARAIIDGELVPLEDEADIRIHPGRLNVIAPMVAVAEAAA